MKAIGVKAEGGFIAALVLLGLLITGQSFGLGFGDMVEPGPGFFPFFIGGLIILTGALTLKQSLRGEAAAGEKETLAGSGLKRFVGMILAFVVWLLLLPWLGFVAVTFLVALAFAKILGLEGWLRPLLLAAGIAVFIYLIFDVWFYADLPRGLFG